MLVVLAHPDLAASRVNAPMAEAASELEDVELLDLYARYPGFDIRVDVEQQRIRNHQVIVFQHPMYWYSSPPLLKQWIDLTWKPGFAYGKDATGTQGKLLASAVTCGAPQRSFESDGWNHFPVEDFLKTFQVTASFCGMSYAAPHVAYDTYGMDDTARQTHIDSYLRWLGQLGEKAAVYDQ